MVRSGRAKRALFIAISGLAVASAAFAIYAGVRGTSSVEADQRAFKPVSRAVFTDERLWLLHDDGLLVSLEPRQNQPQQVPTPGKIMDICKSQARLMAIVDSGKQQWTVQKLEANKWTVQASIPSEGEMLAAVDCEVNTSGVTLITNKRLVEVKGKDISVLKLQQELGPPLANGTALATGDAVWLGLNVGEWGGGLRRISRVDGRVDVVERNRSGDLCGGPLNTQCDPVNGLAVTPWNPSCITAVVGLVHFMPHGRVVEICDKNVRRVYFKPFDPQPPKGSLDDGEPSSTVAFFGLARTGGELWGIGIDGLYRFDGGPPQFRPLPTFEQRGGYSVSFAVPGIVLVLTDVNQRNSLSGSVPLIAAR